MCSVNDFPKGVEHSIKNLINQEEYLTYTIQIQRVITNGGNFLGELYEVDVEGETKDGCKETNLFLKVANGSVQTKWVSFVEVYSIEDFVYRELFEIFSELQEDANVPAQERYRVLKCYKGSSTEAIIMENIAKKGFQICDRVEVLPLEVAKLSIKELAKLHGLSFAMQKKRPDYFNRKIKGIQYPMKFEYFHEYVTNMINLTMPYIDDSVKSRVEDVYYKLADKYAQFFEDEATKRCICHGDYRTNNMMIKMNNEKVVDFIAVDYQFLHYGCPVLDIMFLIFNNTDRQFRRAHLSHLKDLYHETLTTFLGYFNIDVDSVYSREMFEQDFKAKLDYGLLIGFAVMPQTLVNKDDAPDMTGDMSAVTFRVSDTYRDRQRGIIEEFIEWGYI